MIKKLKTFTLQTIAGANIVTIIVMLAMGYSDRLDPTSFPILSKGGLAFPVFLILNFAFLVFWIVFKTRWAIIPFAGFLLCYAPIRIYCPLNITHTPPAMPSRCCLTMYGYLQDGRPREASLTPYWNI